MTSASLSHPNHGFAQSSQFQHHEVISIISMLKKRHSREFKERVGNLLIRKRSFYKETLSRPEIGLQI